MWIYVGRCVGCREPRLARFACTKTGLVRHVSIGGHALDNENIDVGNPEHTIRITFISFQRFKIGLVGKRFNWETCTRQGIHRCWKSKTQNTYYIYFISTIELLNHRASATPRPLRHAHDGVDFASGTNDR